MAKTEPILLRLEPEEKEAFQQAAKITGLPLSMWARERLRWAAIKELEEASIPIAFLQTKRD
ncbi:MAG: hypothetical protein WA666_03070 [Nitrospirota bacterium]